MKGLQFYERRGFRKYSIFSLHCWHNDQRKIHIYCQGILFSFGIEKAKKIIDALNRAIKQIEKEQALKG